MKTYFLDILEERNIIEEDYTPMKILHEMMSKRWCVFNESEDNLYFSFLSDGRLIVSSNGVGRVEGWQHIKSNDSIEISLYGNYYMLRYSYRDEVFLIFKMNGNSEYIILCDSESDFLPEKIEQIQEYLDKKYYEWYG